MQFKHYLFAFIALSAFHTSLRAQNEAITETQLLYMNDFNFGLNANTLGFGGAQFRYGWHKTGSKTNFLETELAIVDDPKSVKRYGFSDNPSQYSYGKLNTVFFWRIGYGRKTELTERSYKNALGLNVVYSGGLNLALLKPVYIDYYYSYDSGQPGGYLISERYDPVKHSDINRIYGNSSFAYGFGELRVIPGAYGRLGLAIDYGQYPDDYKSLEVGMTLDVFGINTNGSSDVPVSLGQGLPIMANISKREYFFGLYLALNWGWKK